MTEVVTGVDLVALQIALAGGARMPMTQREIQPRGHAIEFRITAEDPAQNFQPQAGRSAPIVHRAAHGCDSTRTSTPATRCRRTTTAFSAS